MRLPWGSSINDMHEGGIGHLYLIFEFVRSDLRKFFRSQALLEEGHVRLIMRNLLRGVQHLHGKNIVHRDIKLANILVDADCNIKICDFGLARTLDRESGVVEGSRESVVERLLETKQARSKLERRMTAHVQTRLYRAPEIILLEKEYGPEVDIWACGVIMAELLLMMGSERTNFFAGKSCFPLSPAKKKASYLDRPVLDEFPEEVVGEGATSTD